MHSEIVVNHLSWSVNGIKCGCFNGLGREWSYLVDLRTMLAGWRTTVPSALFPRSASSSQSESCCEPKTVLKVVVNKKRY